MNVAVVKYNAGNALSVMHALQRQGIEPELTDDRQRLLAADKVIFPGVGEANSAMHYLAARGLDALLPRLPQPVLGICLGLQLLCAHSEENDTSGLQVFSQQVRKFPPREKVPHVGWNAIRKLQGPLFAGVPEGAFVYFVHSYYAEPGAGTIATADYIVPLSAALQKGNFFAVQFHPEKSGEIGATILKNFLDL